MPPPLVIFDGKAMRQWAKEQRQRGLRIALVPTMGSLHDAHLALVREASRHGDRVVVSIFVNPTQFGANEDLDAYPRHVEADLAKLATLDVDAVLVPTEAAIYPPGFDTWVVPGELAQPLCGASRPNHFRGVATVVLILLRLTRCHVALFGEKDYQQLQIIRRMVADLWLDVEIVGCPIVRDKDGLAMSSRNGYLSPDERCQALVLSQGLARAEGLVAGGERRADAIACAVRDAIAGAPAARVDYVEVVDAQSLAPVERVETPVLCAVAAWVGGTRLIDNRVLSPVAPTRSSP